MQVLQVRSATELARAAADRVAHRLQTDPRSTLALPTGNTPSGMYAELVARTSAGSLNLAQARIFNLDEYVGLGPTDPHSYAAYLHRHLIGPLHLDARQVCLLRGDAADLRVECRRYDSAIAGCGGIDLCVLGLGGNGHIAFNEPGSDWDLKTHIVALSPTTRAAQAQADSWTVPAFGITMGIRSVLAARQVLLLIAGAGKAAAREAFHRGEEDPQWPVTCLIQHPSVTVIELCAPSAIP